jgi:hypothetical protein
MLEPGEWVIRKEAVKKYGDGFMARLNAGLLKKLPGFNTGGKVSRDDWAKKLNEYERLMQKVNSFAGYISQQTGASGGDSLRYSGSMYPNVKAVQDMISYAEQNLGQHQGITKDYLETAQRAIGQLSAMGGVDDYSRTKERYYDTVRAQNMKAGFPRILSTGEMDFERMLATTFLGNPAEGGSGKDSTTAKIGAAVQKFATGGKVVLPNIRPSLSGIKGSQARTVKHMIDFNIGGRNVGPFEADKSSISDLITELKKAQRVA